MDLDPASCLLSLILKPKAESTDFDGGCLTSCSFWRFPLNLELCLCSSSKGSFASISNKAFFSRALNKGVYQAMVLNLSNGWMKILVEHAHSCAQHCCLTKKWGNRPFIYLPYDPKRKTPKNTAAMRDSGVNGTMNNLQHPGVHISTRTVQIFLSCSGKKLGGVWFVEWTCHVSSGKMLFVCSAIWAVIKSSSNYISGDELMINEIKRYP